MRTWLVAAAIFAADRLSKSWVATHVAAGTSRPLIPGFLHISRIANSGAAFGLGARLVPVFALLSLIVVGGLLGYLWRNRRRRRPLPEALALGLVMGGALGNLVDRLAAGRVLDFIDFRGIWPYIFNVADASVVVGIGLLLLVWSRPAQRSA